LPSTLLATEELSFVDGGRGTATIVIPQEPPKWTRRAAEWLQEYIGKASGARLPVVTEGKSLTGTLISVGHTQLAAEERIELKDFRWDGCRLVARGRVLYLVGRDKAGTSTHDYVGARGTCRAVIKFLEDYCNRFLSTVGSAKGRRSENGNTGPGDGLRHVVLLQFHSRAPDTRFQ
jgi:hypothetical protein